MKRVWGHFLAGGLLVACAAAFATACVHDDSSIFVDAVLEQQLVTPGDQCLYTSDPTQPVIPSGILDIGFRDSYGAEFLVANQIVPLGDPSHPQTETSYVQIQGAVVRITDSQGNQIADYTTLGSVTIPPAQGNIPSFAPIGMEIVDPATVAAISGPVLQGGTRQLFTYTRFFGQTVGGVSVETGEFSFPVTVCYGCLVSYSAADIDVNASVVPNCLLAAGSTTSSSTLPVPCSPGEDDAIDCSQCLGLAVCRGDVAPSNLDAGSDGSPGPVRRAAPLGVVAIVAAPLFTPSPAAADPQASLGLTLGGAVEDDAGRVDGAFHLGGRADVLFLRTHGDEMAIGPYVDAATSSLRDFDAGGGLEWLIPVRDDLPLVVSAGALLRDGEGRSWAPGVEGTVFFGSRSYNFHSWYGLAAGLFAQTRWIPSSPSSPSSADFIIGVQIDAELLAMPSMLIISALRN